MMLEDEFFFIDVEEVPDFHVFAEKGILFEYSKVALAPSGFLGFVLDKVWFIQCSIIFDILGVPTINFLSFLCLVPPIFMVFIPC